MIASADVDTKQPPGTTPAAFFDKKHGTNHGTEQVEYTTSSGNVNIFCTVKRSIYAGSQKSLNFFEKNHKKVLTYTKTRCNMCLAPKGKDKKHQTNRTNMNNMIDRTQIAAAMAYYDLDDMEDLKPHMIEASYADFCNALIYFDDEKKLGNMPWWAAKTLYKLLTSEAFEDYDSGNDVLPYNLDVSNRDEMEWVIDLVQSWGVYDSDPNKSIDANENHYFVCAADYGMGMSDCWVEIFKA